MQRQKSATTALIAINVVIYLLSIIGIGTVYQLGIFERAVIDGHQWYRLFTALFSHFSIPHILCNSIALLSIGPIVETAIGPKRFLAIYLLGGILGNFIAMVFHGVLQPNVLMAGASMSIFAILGHLVHIYLNRKRLFYYGFSSKFLRGIIITFILSSLGGGDFIGHFCGFIAGVIMSVLFVRRRA